MEVASVQIVEQIKDPLAAIFEKFEVKDALEDLRKMGYDDISKIRDRDVYWEQLEKASKGQLKRRQQIENAIASVKSDLIQGFVDKKLMIVYKTMKVPVDYKDFIIGNTEGANLYIPGPVYSTTQESVSFEVIVTYQQGRYWVINNPIRPLRDFYVRLNPDSQNMYLRAEDSIKVGNVELQISRFNVGRAEDRGTRDYMEDRMVVIQDLNISPKIDVSLFAVFDGYSYMIQT